MAGAQVREGAVSFGTARSAEPGMMGLDSLAMLSDVQLAAFANRGFTFVGGYLEVATAEYVQRVHAHGMSFLPIAEARTFEPLTADVGRSSALLELSRSHALGMPGGVNVVIDLEDPAQGTTLEGAVEYIDACAGGLEAGAQPAILYVANPQPLNGGQLYARPAVHLYWSGASDNPDIACGYALFQLLPIDYRPSWGIGAKVDLDVISADRRGRLPVLWYPS